MRSAGHLLLLALLQSAIDSTGASSSSTRAGSCNSGQSAASSSYLVPVTSQLKVYSKVQALVDALDKRPAGATTEEERQQYHDHVCSLNGNCGNYKRYYYYYSQCSNGMLMTIQHLARGQLGQALNECMCGSIRTRVTSTMAAYFDCDLARVDDTDAFQGIYIDKVQRLYYFVRKRMLLTNGLNVLEQSDTLIKYCVLDPLKNAVKPLRIAKPKPTPTSTRAATLSPPAAGTSTNSGHGTHRDSSNTGAKATHGSVSDDGTPVRWLVAIWTALPLLGIVIAFVASLLQQIDLSDWRPLLDMDQLQRRDDIPLLPASPSSSSSSQQQQSLQAVTPAPPSSDEASSSNETTTAASTPLHEEAAAVADMVNATTVEPSPRHALNHPD